MTTVAARPQRPIPTVQASPELLALGDRAHTDLPGFPGPFTVTGNPEQIRDCEGALVGWRIPIIDICQLLIPAGHKVRTQRRPNPGPPTPDEAWDAAMEHYPRSRYG